MKLCWQKVRWVSVVLLFCQWLAYPVYGRDGGNVILIGIDGLRPDSFAGLNAPTLQGIARSGVQARSLIPVMPTKTFVNFYSLATGLYPVNHGIITNAPYDRRMQRIFSNKHDTRNPDWWQGEPIWVTAEKQGLNAATYFWVGSEVPIDGVQASIWKPYQQSKDYAERIAEVLSWLDLPEAERPQLITLYFSAVDTASHDFGVNSREEHQAIEHIDRQLADLLKGLAKRGLTDSYDIIVVSDHGLADIAEQRMVNLDNWVDLTDWLVFEWRNNANTVSGPFLFLFNDNPAEVDQLYQQLHQVSSHLKVYRKGQYPDYYHFDHPQRGPDLLLLADPGWLVFASKNARFKGKPAELN